MRNNINARQGAYKVLKRVPRLYFGGEDYEPVDTGVYNEEGDVQNRNVCYAIVGCP
jgi:hypothetical protein